MNASMYGTSYIQLIQETLFAKRTLLTDEKIDRQATDNGGGTTLVTPLKIDTLK